VRRRAEGAGRPGPAHQVVARKHIRGRRGTIQYPLSRAKEAQPDRVLELGLAGFVGHQAATAYLYWQRKVDSFGSSKGCGTTFPGHGQAGCKRLYDDGQQARQRAFVGYGGTGAPAATAIVLYGTDSGKAGSSAEQARASIASCVWFRAHSAENRRPV